MVVWYIERPQGYETFCIEIEAFEAFEFNSYESAWIVPGTLDPSLD